MVPRFPLPRFPLPRIQRPRDGLVFVVNLRYADDTSLLTYLLTSYWLFRRQCKRWFRVIDKANKNSDGDS